MPDWREGARAAREEAAKFIFSRNKFVEELENLEDRGRKLWAEGIRTGKAYVARSPSELRALGLAFVPGQLPNATAVLAANALTKQLNRHQSRSRSQSTGKRRSAAADQVLAGARGAQDAFTLGAGDHVYAGARAVGDAFGGEPLRQAYDKRISVEHERDRYDAKHYPVARATGQVAGTVAGLAVLGPVDGALAGGVRMVEATPLVAREIAALGGAGATAGVAGQGLEDFQRQRLGSVQDYIASALGGATSGIASVRLGPGQAGALGGVVTSVAQDALNGRRVSLPKAGDAALAGGYFAAPFGLAGRAYSEGLHFSQKGKLGDTLGRVRTRVNGTEPEPGGRRVKLPSGRVTVLDSESNAIPILEYKFGRKAHMRRNQLEASAIFGPEDYRTYHFTPRDVGSGYGLMPGQFALHEVLDRE